MNTLAKIEALESKLSTSLAARPVVVDALTRRIAKAEAIRETFQKSPSQDGVAGALEAVTTGAAAKTLLSNLGEEKPWRAYVENAWIVRHRSELTELLESLFTERTSRREVYRQAKAEEIGRLCKEIVLLDGSGASDEKLEAVNAELAQLEEDLASRESNLHAATDAIRSFSRAREDASAYQSVYTMYHRAKQAAAALDFSEAVNLEKTQA